jgi:hypothetical protein
MSKDMIKRPEHYCFSKFEPKDVIREWGLNFNLGSAVKYIARAGRKDDIVQDLKKAREFLGFEIEALEADRGLTEDEQKELEEITKKNAEISKALRFYRAFLGVVDKLNEESLRCPCNPDGFAIGWSWSTPIVSLDEEIDKIIKGWEESLK